MASKGTTSKGLRLRKGRLHVRCARCGKTAYHAINKICASCDFGKSKKLRKYSWMKRKRSKHSYRIKWLVF